MKNHQTMPASPAQKQAKATRKAKEPGTAPLQKATDATSSAPQKKTNGTGLPDTLKSGLENLSGYSMDNVNVHYNSGKPAQLHAHAYAQGEQIHLAPGQEKHLPHEAWHVVQQKQGRVKATTQLKGVAVNDDSALEKEADVMGSRAALAGTPYAPKTPAAKAADPAGQPVQGYFTELYQMALEYAVPIATLLVLVATYGLWRVRSFLQSRSGDKNLSREVQEIAARKKSLPEPSGSEKEKAKPKESDKAETPKETPKGKSLMEGVPGDCLYTAVGIARGGHGAEDALRQIATQWILAQPADSEVFQYADQAALVQVVSQPQQWAGDAGDLSAVVLAHSLGIRLEVVTAGNVYVFNQHAGIAVRIYYHANHYTSMPVQGVHAGGSEVYSDSRKKKTEDKPKPGDSTSEALAEAPLKVDRNALTPVEAQDLRNLAKGLGNQAHLSDTDRRILALIRVILQNDTFSKPERAEINRYKYGLSHGPSSGGGSSRSREDQFQIDNPEAIRIGADGWKGELNSAIGSGRENIANRAMNDPRVTGAVWPGADRVTHWTQGGNSGGTTGFVAHVGSAAFFVAMGHHRTSSTYGLDWQASHSGSFSGGVVDIEH